MIKNLSKQLTVVSSLPFDCYQTGSRFFGVNKPYSDWDFFTLATEETERFLKKSIDWYKVDDSQYMHGDEFITGVYKHYYQDIDLQLVKNVKIKNAAQETLKHYPVFFDCHKVDKEKQKELWRITQKAIQFYISYSL
jgi:hypothetical protein